MAVRIIAAFDIGTTYSGFAFSFYDKPLAVRSNYGQAWEERPPELVSMKTASSLLLAPGGVFNKFGYGAEEKYSSLVKENKQGGWRLFRQFKMILHNNKSISPSTTVDDINGSPMLAMDVFSMSIGSLRGNMLDAVMEFLSYNDSVDVKTLDIRIQYVITVPAIWDDSARMFMTEAATKAGIDPAKLRLVLEPEAASVWGQSLNAEKLALSGDGIQYMVVDLGGGTADISVHEKKVDGTLKEIHTSTGGPWGGKFVDENYIKLLRQVFGDVAIDTFKSREMGDYLSMLREFEIQKTHVGEEATDKITLHLPQSLLGINQQPCNLMGYGDKMTIENGMFVIDVTVVKNWFDVPIDSLIDHIKGLLNEPKLAGVSALLLVGGFGENKYVQEKMKSELQAVRVIVPDKAGMVTLTGAVMSGHIPHLVTSKIRRYANDNKNHSLFNCLKTDTGSTADA